MPFVSVSVVDVRPVRVAVNQPVVAVPVAMTHGGVRGLEMRVWMVAIVMAVGVYVLDGLMSVGVLVLAPEEHRHGNREKSGAGEVLPPDRLA